MGREEMALPKRDLKRTDKWSRYRSQCRVSVHCDMEAYSRAAWKWQKHPVICLLESHFIWSFHCCTELAFCLVKTVSQHSEFPEQITPFDFVSGMESILVPLSSMTHSLSAFVVLLREFNHDLIAAKLLSKYCLRHLIFQRVCLMDE